MRIIRFLIIFLFVACTQRTTSNNGMAVGDSDLKHHELFLTDTSVIKEVIVNDICVNIERKVKTQGASSVMFAAKAMFILKELTPEKFKYELLFPSVCITRNDTCFVFFSSRLGVHTPSMWRDNPKTKAHCFVYQDKYKPILDKNTMNNIILIASETFEKRLYYAIKNGDINNMYSKYNVGEKIAYTIPFWPVPLEVESVYDSNEEY